MKQVPGLFLTSCALTALLSVDAAAQAPAPAPGVAFDLAQARARLVSDLRYELSLSVPRERSQPVRGTIEIRFQLADASQPLVLDFAATREFIGVSLGLLKEVHETSNLGFPNLWLYYMLYGQNSRNAAGMVTTFLETLPPDYPAHLRHSILRASDLLFRGTRILARPGRPHKASTPR